MASRDKRHGTQMMGLWSSQPRSRLWDASCLSDLSYHRITHLGPENIYICIKICILGILELPQDLVEKQQIGYSQNLGREPGFSFIAVCHWVVLCPCHVWTYADWNYLSCFSFKLGNGLLICLVWNTLILLKKHCWFLLQGIDLENKN